MSIRLILLILVAAGLAIGFAMKSSAPPTMQTEAAELAFDTDDGRTLDEIREEQRTLAERPLPGEEPPVEPEFAVAVSVDPTGKKNRLLLDVTEEHGYYVESFRIGVWYKPTPDTTLQESPWRSETFVDLYLKSNETLRVCMDLVPAEANKFGGHLGSAENWEGKVLWHNRSREKNPAELPRLAEAYDCD
jgi:hypothetical protein